MGSVPLVGGASSCNAEALGGRLGDRCLCRCTKGPTVDRDTGRIRWYRAERHLENHLPNNLNVSFLGVNNKGFVTNLSEHDPEIVVAADAACSTSGEKTETSHVMRMITDDEDRIGLRFKQGSVKGILKKIELTRLTASSLKKYRGTVSPQSALTSSGWRANFGVPHRWILR